MKPVPTKITVLNTSLMLGSILAAGYVLLSKAPMLLLVYGAAWALILTVGRFVVCRHCLYYGENCATFAFGHVARIFPASSDRRFRARAAGIDASAIVLVQLLPAAYWVWSLVSEQGALGRTEHLLMAAYLGLGVAAAVAHHLNGCRRCPIQECPLCAAKPTCSSAMPAD
jgi:hypothetical protein